MSFTFKDFCTAADEIVDRLPGKLKRDVAIMAEEHEHECQAFGDGRKRGRDLIFGYFQNFYGQKRIVLCYWAFVAWSRYQGEGYDWRKHLEDVVAHEFIHSVENEMSHQPLAEQERQEP